MNAREITLKCAEIAETLSKVAAPSRLCGSDYNSGHLDGCNAVAATLRAYAETLGDGWLPIESAPKDGTEILRGLSP